MKSKRFIENTIPIKAWRKLSLRLRNTWIYLWMNCDESGVYLIDEDLFEFENSYEFDMETLKENFRDYLEFGDGKVLIKKFAFTNYGNEPNPDYNPHKPLFRALSRNNVKLNLSLHQACFKLVEEDVEVEVREEEEEEKKCDSQKNEIDEVLNYLNDLADRDFKIKTESHRAKVRARLNDGFTVDQMKKVIELKLWQSENTKKFGREYLRPETLFGPKMDGYVQECLDFKKGKTQIESKQIDFETAKRAIDAGY